MITAMSPQEVEQVLTDYLKKRYKFAKIEFTNDFREIMFETFDKPASTKGGYKVTNHGLLKFLEIELQSSHSMKMLHSMAITKGRMSYPDYNYFCTSVRSTVDKYVKRGKFKGLKIEFMSEGKAEEFISVKQQKINYTQYEY